MHLLEFSKGDLVRRDLRKNTMNIFVLFVNTENSSASMIKHHFTV